MSLVLLNVVVHLWQQKVAVEGTKGPRPGIPRVIHDGKWRSDETEDEEMERRPRRLACESFMGKE